MRKNIANIITFTRIIATIIMVFTSVLSPSFFIAYTYAGLSDVIDGFIARRLHIESDFGRKLDSVSDLLFYTSMMIKIWPYLVAYLPLYIWALIWTVFGIRLALYLFVSIGQRKLLSNHTYLNKATGCLMFLIPFLLETKYFVSYAKLVVYVALLSAVYEIVLVIKGKTKS